MRISAAISPCPNDVFIFAGLLSGAVKAQGLELEFGFHDLQTMNRGAQQGRWDMAKISYANHALVAKDYRLLRCGGALGRGCGPLLLSNRPGASAEGWDRDAEVLVPGEHTTANFLLDFYAQGTAAPGSGEAGNGPEKTEGNLGVTPLRKTFLPFDELYRRLLGPEPCQGVVIHEMRFTYAADGLRLVRDLGEFWEKRTGYPIPLGAVALRLRCERDRAGLGAALENAIRASLDWSYDNEAEALELCRAHSQSMSEDVLRSHIGLYVNAFSRDIGREGEAAIEFFLSRQRGFQSGV